MGSLCFDSPGVLTFGRGCPLGGRPLQLPGAQATLDLRAYTAAMLTRLVVLLALTNASVAADAPPAAAAVRDGVWLQKGIKQYERRNAHENLSDKEASDALVVTSYVCAVLDLEKYLVQRAALLSGALKDGKKKRHLDPKMLDGMSRALPLVIPLLKTRFLATDPSCDSALAIVRDYLEKYPEMLDKEADVIVEKALLDAYTEYP
jgi:hypothetical protein